MRAFIVDDHALVRMGLRMLLAKTKHFDEILEFDTLEAAIDDASARPDLVVLDLGLPDADDLDAVIAVRSRIPEARVLVVAGTEDREMIDRAFSHGASGFVPKSSSGDAVAAAVSVVLQGQVYVPPHVLPSLHRPSRPSSARPASSSETRLTTRQTDVLRGVVRGLQNKEIAKELDMSPATVRAHVSAILLALGVENRTQAAMHPFARALGGAPRA